MQHLLRLKQVPHHSLEDTDIEALADAAHGYVGADLVALVNEAALVALRCAVALIESDTVALVMRQQWWPLRVLLFQMSQTWWPL